jgi:hypothetical protein
MMIAVLYLNSQCEHYALLVICRKYQFAYLLCYPCEEPDNNWNFAISRLTYWMKSAYVIKIEINTRLIFTDFEDNRVSINGLDNVTITVSWNSDIVESQTCSSTVLFLFLAVIGYTLIHHPVQKYKMIQLFNCRTSFVPPYKIKNVWTN